MLAFFDRWRPRHLAMAWAAYWLSAISLTLARPALLVWRLSRSAPGHGSLSTGIDDGTAHLSVIRDGVTAWAASASLSTIALVIAGPPLLLWVGWLLRRPRRHETSDAYIVPADATPLIGRGEASAIAEPARATDRAPASRDW